MAVSFFGGTFLVVWNDDRLMGARVSLGGALLDDGPTTLVQATLYTPRTAQSSLSFDESHLLWQNRYRFFSESRLRSHLKALGQDRRGVARGADFLKVRCADLEDACLQIVTIGEQRWQYPRPQVLRQALADQTKRRTFFYSWCGDWVA